MSLKKDMNNSANEFRAYVWPVISSHNYHILQMENEFENKLACDLDMIAGIDAWIKAPRGLIGIAARVQWLEKGVDPYDSYTIRIKRDTGAVSELEKRLTSIKEDMLYPQLTVQAYLEKDTSKVISVGIIKTKDLFDHIEKGKPSRVLRTSNAEFLAIDWSALKKDYRICSRIGDLYTNLRYEISFIKCDDEPMTDAEIQDLFREPL